MGAGASVAVAAFCASAAEIAICYPLDTVKTRMQAQHGEQASMASSKAQYRGPLHCAVLTVQREGWGGLYRGLPCAVAQSLLWMLCLLGAIDWLRRATGATIFSPLSFASACVVIGALEALLFCPFDHVKARLQLKGSRRRGLQSASGSWGALSALGGASAVGETAGKGSLQGLLAWAEKQCAAAVRTAREVTAARGWAGLYTGWVYHFLKEAAGAAALLGVYDVAVALSGGRHDSGHRVGSQHVHPQGLHWLHLWPAGCLASMAYFTVGFVFDALKTRIQTDSLSVPRYRNSAQVAATAMHYDGPGDLFKGLNACVCRAVPGSAIKIVVFEACLAILTALASVPWTVDREMWDVDKLNHLEHILI